MANPINYWGDCGTGCTCPNCGYYFVPNNPIVYIPDGSFRPVCYGTADTNWTPVEDPPEEPPEKEANKEDEPRYIEPFPRVQNESINKREERASPNPQQMRRTHRLARSNCDCTAAAGGRTANNP